MREVLTTYSLCQTFYWKSYVITRMVGKYSLFGSGQGNLVRVSGSGKRVGGDMHWLSHLVKQKINFHFGPQE